MNFLTENKIEYYSELESKIADIMTAHDAAARAVKDVEQRMSDLSLLIKHTTTYRQLKPIYEEYKKSRDKEKYLRGHESEIILFEAAARALKEMQIKKLPDLAALRKEYSSLNDRKSKLYEDYRQAKKQMQERNGGAAGRQAALDMDKVFPQRDRGHKPLFLPVVKAGQNAVVFLRDCRRSKYFVIQFLLGICKV